MASVNQATIIGYVGEDPKIITTSNGKTMATLTVATTERGYTKRDGTTSEDRTEWHNIVLFGKLAEIARDYIRKGAALYIQGKMRTRSYDDKDGIKRYVTEIHALTRCRCSTVEAQRLHNSTQSRNSNTAISSHQ